MISRLAFFLSAASSIVVSAYPQASLPSFLQDSIPQCARSCLDSQITSTFSLSCSSSSGLDCLCSQYSKAGLALNEAALSCYYQNCPRDEGETSTINNICKGKPNAVPATHAQIPVTTLYSGPTTLPSTLVSSELPQSTLINPPRPTPITTSLSSDAPAPTSPASETSMVSTESTEKTSGPLTTSQIVGVSVAGAAALILAAGAIVLMTCVQQRRARRAMEQEKLEYSDFQNEKQSHPHQPERKIRASLRPLLLPKLLKDPRGGIGGVGVAAVQKPGSNSQPASQRPSDNSSPRRSIVNLAPVHTNLPGFQFNDQAPQSDASWKKSSLPTSQIGLALSPESGATSPDSMTSSRTVSQLLPSKPSPTAPRPYSTISGLTVFEEDTDRKSLKPSQAIHPPMPKNQPHLDHPSSTSVSSTEGRYTDPSMVPLPLNHIRSASNSPPPLPPAGSPPTKPLPQAPRASFTRTSHVRRPSTDLVPTRPKMIRAEEQPTLSLAIPIRHSRAPEESQVINGIKHVTSPVLPPKPPTTVYAHLEYMSPAVEAPPPFPTMVVPTSNARLPSPKRDSDTSHGSDTSNSTEGYIPKYYTPKTSASTSTAKSPKLVNIRRAGSNKTFASMSRASTIKSTSRRDSMASCTTFESVDQDEPTPPSDDEDKILSAIPESPISGLRYPKVPRASNQAVPRSPKSPRSSQNSQTSLRVETQSSLLAKRRGEETAQHLQNGFFVSPLSATQGSSRLSRHRYSRLGSDGKPRLDVDFTPITPLSGNPGMVAALRSPGLMWEPRITPTRRGQDLFLSVE